MEKVTVTEEVNDKSSDETLTTKKYVDGKLENVAAKFTVKGDTNGAGGKDYTLDKNNELNIKGAESPTGHRNISTTVDANSKAVTIELNKI